MKKVIIIGSGFSSLSAACYLQKAGYQVTVLEKNEQLGGRCSVLEEQGFKFDMGPSWYWMPDIFENFFQDFEKKVEDYYTLEKLSPAYRVYFGKNDFIDIEDEPEKIIAKFEAIELGSGARLQKFIKKAQKNYKIAMKVVYNPGLSLLELVTPETAIRFNLFLKSITQDVKKITKHPKLRSILEFPVLFLGAKPSDTPAFYNFMNYADFGLGTWYPKGGMYKIIEGMVQLGQSLGVQYHTNEKVTRIEIKEKKAKSVITENNQFKADIVVSGADYHHTENLLGSAYRNYPENDWNKKTFAPSSFLYFVGFKGELNNVLHHNLCFDTDFTKHAEEIYDEKCLPKNPLFYANFPSMTDKNLAPSGMSTAFFLIPVAVDLNDNQELHNTYFNLIVKRLEEMTGDTLKDKIVYKKSFGVHNFKKRYNSCKGNAYGLANTLLQTSVLRPSIKNKTVKNFFYTGQLTVPGPGVPPALISGKVVSDYILKQKL